MSPARDSGTQGEAFSRVLIDKAFEASGWNLLDPEQVQFEHNTANGRVDYLLNVGVVQPVSGSSVGAGFGRI